MKTDTFRFKIFSILTLHFFLHACTVHTIKIIPKEELKEMQNTKIIILHHNDHTYLLNRPVLSEGFLSGNIKTYVTDDKRNNNIYNEIHIYLKLSDSELSLIKSEKVSINIENISKIEIYEADTKKAVLNLAAGFGVLILIATGILIWYMQNMKTELY